MSERCSVLCLSRCYAECQSPLGNLAGQKSALYLGDVLIKGRLAQNAVESHLFLVGNCFNSRAKWAQVRFAPCSYPDYVGRVLRDGEPAILSVEQGEDSR